jgi:glyoxylase-like metal-dependent hydrolase (beta-lactamase superfamily II)
MTNTIRRATGTLALLIFALWSISAFAQGSPPAMVQRKIADDVYTMEHPLGLSNSTFVVTPDGVLVFDADIRTGDQVMAAIRRTTDKKVKYLVISHPSGDHATGGWYFREDRPLIIGTRK